MQGIDTDKIIQALNPAELEFAGFFGSRARGEERENSDLDILVRFKRPQGLLRLASLQRQLSEIAGIPVDLITEQALSPYIKSEVMNELKTFYGKR